jgi:putative addiction module component (TIGR02574 family)
MSAIAEALLDSALRLPKKERARLASDLLASLDGAPDAGVEAAWDSEVERRLREVDEGKVPLLDWEDVKIEVSRALNRR